MTSTRVYQDNGLSVVGITTTIPVLGVAALVDINGATITANGDHHLGQSGTLQTTLRADIAAATPTTLDVASVAGFDDAGTVTVAGLGDCTYTGRDITEQPVHGRLRLHAAARSPTGAVVTHGHHRERAATRASATPPSTSSTTPTSTSTATRSITANGGTSRSASSDRRHGHRELAAPAPTRATGTSGDAYTKGDVVKDTDGKKYVATKDVPRAPPPIRRTTPACSATGPRRSRRTPRSSPRSSSH